MSDQKVTKETLERRVVTYLPPLYHRLLKAYVHYQELSESATMVDIVKKHFDSMPEKERQRILNYSKNGY